jgi:hypothetical protein
MHKGNIMNMFNQKSILYLSLSSLILSGCTTTNELTSASITPTMVQNKPLNIKVSQAKNSWNQKKLPIGKIDKDCIDCYAKPITKQEHQAKRTYYAKVNTNVTKSIGPYKFVETDADRNVRSDYLDNKPVSSTSFTAATTPTYSSYGSYPDYSTLGSTSIQVGAFRQYSGAKTTRNKYDNLTNKYNVAIQTGTKGNKPIHRVRIEGFKNRTEAKKFINNYGLTEAFLVSE